MLNQVADVAQATVALWVANVAGALASFNTGLDVFDDRACRPMPKLGLNVTDRVSKAIAYNAVRVARVFLVDSLAQFILGEYLLSIGPVICGWAIGRRTKAVAGLR